MFQWTILSLFLYFPEDKTEYIPAVISFAIFFAACILTFRLIVKKSRKDAAKAKELEDKIMNGSMNNSEHQ